MTDVRSNIISLRSSIPAGVELVAVSKFHPVEALKDAYDAGQRIFGESRAPELELKARELPEDIEWHFIGHLQTNKVRKVVAHASLIHSIDSERASARRRRRGRKARQDARSIAATPCGNGRDQIRFYTRRTS